MDVLVGHFVEVYSTVVFRGAEGNKELQKARGSYTRSKQNLVGMRLALQAIPVPNFVAFC